MATTNRARQAEADALLREPEELYERYGKPLEARHWGEYVAIRREGKTLLGSDLLVVAQEAIADFGPGGFLI